MLPGFSLAIILNLYLPYLLSLDHLLRREVVAAALLCVAAAAAAAVAVAAAVAAAHLHRLLLPVTPLL